MQVKAVNMTGTAGSELLTAAPSLAIAKPCVRALSLLVLNNFGNLNQNAMEQHACKQFVPFSPAGLFCICWCCAKFKRFV